MKSNNNIKVINKKSLLNNVLPYIIILIMTIGLLLMSSSTGVVVGLYQDAAVYLNVARNLLNGKVLYTGIVDNKGPVLYFINALFLKLGGQIGIILLEFITLYLIFLFAYKTIKLLNDNKKHQIILLCLLGTYLFRFFTRGLSCEEYALAFSMIGLYECIKYYKNDKFSIYQCFSLGLLGGLCFFIRQNLIVVFAGFGIGIFIKHIIEKRYKELIKYIIFSILGFLTIALPILGYLVINNSFNDYIYYTFTLNMNISRIGVIDSLVLMFEMIPLTFILIVIYSVLLIKQLIKRKELKDIGILITIVITVFFNTIGAIVAYHYLLMFIPFLLLMYCRFLQNNNGDHSYSFQRVVLYIIILINVVSNIIPTFNSMYYGQPYLDIINYVKDHTTPNDTIAVVGMSDEVYYLTKRESVSKYTYLTFANVFDIKEYTKMLNDYLNDIMTKKPKIIVLDAQTLVYGLKQVLYDDEFFKFLDNNYNTISYDDYLKEYNITDKKDLELINIGKTIALYVQK